MMPCKYGEERQGWVRDGDESAQIVATTQQFERRRVLQIKCQSLIY